jgi:hypothetical protein
MDNKERENIRNVVKNLGTAQKFLNLYERWQDEKDYEDFNEYVTAMMKSMPTGAKLIKGTKRPFGVFFNYGGNTVLVAIEIEKGYCQLVAKIANG